MANPDFILNSSEVSYDYEEIFIKLAQKFFNIEDVSLAKAGMFGYVNEVASHIAKDATFHRNMLYNEFFLNTAKLDSSLYNWAKILDEPLQLANPARINTIFKVNLNNVFKNASESILSSTEASIKVLTINKDIRFYIGNMTYMLPMAMQLSYTVKNNRLFSTEVKFIKEKSNLNTSLVSSYIVPSLYLKTYRDTGTDGQEYLNILVPLIQVDIATYKYTVLSNDIVDKNLYEVNYNNNISSFNIYYVSPSDPLKIKTKLNILFNELADTYGTDSAYYSLIGDNTLRIYFSNKTGFFKPELGSELTIEVVTSKGSEGNFKYQGNVLFNDDLLETIGMSITAVSSSSGGTDNKDFRTNKIALMNKLRTRDSIITDYDINSLFERLKYNILNTSSDMVAIKTKNDFFERYFSVYILLRTSKKEVIPTNTINLELNLLDIEANNYSLKPGTIIIYDRTNGRYRLLEQGEFPDVYLNNLDSYVYCIPFLMNFDFNLFPKINYYSTNYNRSIAVFYNDINLKVPYNAIINSYSIYRNTLYDIDKFTLSCYLNTNIPTYDQIKLRVFLTYKNAPIAFAEMKLQPGTNEYKLDIRTSDTFDQNGNFLVENTFYDIDTEQLIPIVPLEGEYKFEFALFYKDDTLAASLTETERLVFNTTDRFYLRMDSLRKNKYIFVSNFRSDETVQIAEDLNDIMHTKVTYLSDTGKIALEGVPLISANFFYNMEFSQEMSIDMHNIFTSVRESIRNLENNTSMNIKLFNTYGMSRNYTSDTIDISLSFQINLKVLQSNTLDNKIKQYIVKFIEDSNINVNAVDIRFSLSNLIRNMEINMPEINYIKFVSINNSNIQNIEKIFVDGKKPLPVNYIPEFLTVKKKPGKNPTTGDEYVYCIDIQYI